jgi:hypothetical protein
VTKTNPHVRFQVVLSQGEKKKEEEKETRKSESQRLDPSISGRGKEN